MIQDNQTSEYDFTLVLAGITELTPEIADRLLEAGCDDATIAMRSGRPFITFSRRAPPLRTQFSARLKTSARSESMY